jgi:hypothetical protein
MNKKLCKLCVIIVGMSLASLVSAHEMRHLCEGGKKVGLDCENVANTLMFHVGFVNEPAWATDTNGANINLSFHPDAEHDPAKVENVDTAKGDVVDLYSVEAQYFGSESKYHRGMKAKRSTIIYSDGKQAPVVHQNQPDANGNIAKKFGTDNVYNAYFRPAKSGVYGFVIKGMVKHGENVFDFSDGQSFVCGAEGTQDEVSQSEGKPQTKYGCVMDEIAFPSQGKGRDD